MELDLEVLPLVENPYAVQTYGVGLAFVICFRTQIAWARYWEANAETQLMWSKWNDAFMQLIAFINSTARMLAPPNRSPPPTPVLTPTRTPAAPARWC